MFLKKLSIIIGSCLFLLTTEDGISLASIDEFNNALVLNAYPMPLEDQYNNFISRISDGGIDTKRELAMFLVINEFKLYRVNSVLK